MSEPKDKEESLRQMLVQISSGMKSGRIDVEAGKDTLERIQDQLATHGGVASTQGRSLGGKRKTTPWDKLCVRMDWNLQGAATERKLALMEDAGYVFVMGVVNGEHFCIKDDGGMFPSDQVVTQLRMLYDGE